MPLVKNVVALVCWAVICLCGCQRQQETNAVPTRDQASAVSTNLSENVESVVNNIQKIKTLAPKDGEPQVDPYAIAVVRLGPQAGPLLVEKITNQTVTDCYIYPTNLAVGDIAIELLHAIYGGSWPAPDGSVQIPSVYNSNLDYFEFVTRPENRVRLQTAWRNWLLRNAETLKENPPH
jgi:hypothetical protein